MKHRKAPRNTGQARLKGVLGCDVPPSMWGYLRPPYNSDGDRPLVTVRWCVAVTRWLCGGCWRHRGITIPVLVFAAWPTTFIPAFLVGLAVAVDELYRESGRRARIDYRFKRQVQDAVVRVVCSQKDTAPNNPLRALPSWLSSTQHYWPHDLNGDGHVTIWERLNVWISGPLKPHSATATIKLPLGVSDAVMREVVHQIDRVLDADCTMTLLGQGRAQLRVAYEDVLARPMPYTPYTGVSLSKILVARNRWGDSEYRCLVGPNGARSWLFSGVTGSGKTSAINAVLLDLIWLKLMGAEFELNLVDPLGGVDIGWAHQFADHVAKNRAEAGEMMTKAAAGIFARTAVMPRGLEKVTGPNPDFPPRIWVLDELGVLLRAEEGGIDKKMTGAMITMVTNGRKTGDAVIAATQMLNTKIVDSLIREQFQDRIGLRTMTRAQTNVVFGDKLEERVNLARVPEDQQGRCWWMASILEEMRLRGAWGKVLAQRVVQLEHLAKSRPAPVLASQPPVLVPSVVSPLPGPQTGSESSNPLTGEGSAERRVRGSAVVEIEAAFRTVNGSGATLEQIATIANRPLSTVKYHVLERQNIPTEKLKNYRYRMIEEAAK